VAPAAVCRELKGTASAPLRIAQKIKSRTRVSNGSPLDFSILQQIGSERAPPSISYPADDLKVARLSEIPAATSE
jgi:hypothetical protein